MRDIELNLIKQMMETRGYQEQERPPRGDRWRQRLIRMVLVLLLFVFCFSCIRQGINAYLAKRAEGSLQTASSYEKIYQSFERVEAKQLRIQKKWENHRGINLSLEMPENNNLSSLMSGVSSSIGEVKNFMGIGGGYGIGQYRRYMATISGESGSEISVGSEKNQDCTWQYIAEESDDLAERQEREIEPDQFVVDGEYIYALWREGDFAYEEGIARLVVYHATGGRMEQIYVSRCYMEDGYGTELMVSDHYLYITTNGYESYETDTPESQNNCLTYIYDITDPEKPERVRELTQAGEYVSMKIQGGYLYLFSKFQDFEAWDQAETDDYIPMVGGQKIAPEDIYMQRDLYGTGYVVMSVYHLENPVSPELIATKAVAGTAEMIQISDNRIYICSNVVPKKLDRTDRTGVTILSYEDGEIEGINHMIIAGTIDPTQPTDVDDAGLRLHMQVSSYRGSFVEIEDWIFPGWENVPLKIQMGEKALGTEEQIVCVEGKGDRVHVVETLTSEEMIWDTSFRGQLFAVDEQNFVGVGHTGEDKNMKLLWYRFVAEDEPVVQESLSFTEYYSPVTENVRMIYFDQDRRLIGFCATGSQGTRYYLYRYQQDSDTGEVQFEKLCEENFNKDYRATWIRGTVMPAEEDLFYMVRNGGAAMSGLVQAIP